MSVPRWTELAAKNAKIGKEGERAQWKHLLLASLAFLAFLAARLLNL
jgi:hypothetical protein